MSEVTRLLDAAPAGDRQAAAEVLPLVDDELRRLATARMVQEKPGQTLNATALVHEAYVRRTGQEPHREWSGRGHFFGAAAEAMRRILVESGRRKARLKRGGDGRRVEPPDDLPAPAAGRRRREPSAPAGREVDAAGMRAGRGRSPACFV